jgi:hypothetical protein
MLLVIDLTTLKSFYILINFGSFSYYFLLPIVSEIFAQLLNVYAPKYEIVENFGLFNKFSHPKPFKMLNLVIGELISLV